MLTQKQSASEQLRVKAECWHHWVIERPKRGRSKGICKHCGATKWFDGLWEGFDWEDEVRMPD